MRSGASATTGMFGTGRNPVFPVPRLLLPILLATAAPATPAFSQQLDPSCRAPEGASRELRSGQCVRSTIDAADPKNEAGVPYEDWNLPLAAGEVVQIDMDAIPPAPASNATGGADEAPRFAFDTFLELRRPGSADVVASNDDREGSVNSTITFTAPAAGTYVVRARPLFQGSGEYVLRVAPFAPPVARRLSEGPNVVPPVISGGNTIQLRLFTFEGRAGDRVRLNLSREGSGFGTSMQLIGPGSARLAMVGEFSESLTLSEILPDTGTYRVEVRLHNFGDRAQPAVLDFERLAAVPLLARAARVVRVGETVEGELNFESPAVPDPSANGRLIFNQLYALRVRAGQVITVLLESDAFDPVLEAGGMTLLGFGAVLTNDDYGDGLNSRLVLRPDRAGTIILRARPLGSGTGTFHLRITEGEPTPPTQ